jgi:N-acetylglucosamine-6-sulfatase
MANTYFIYTSDNGFHMGKFRLPPGKICNIEEDINIPFLIRGPGIPRGAIKTFPTTHTDVVTTLFELAGIHLHDNFDGEPIPVTEMAINSKVRAEHVNVEFWSNAIVGEGPIFRRKSSFMAYYAESSAA